jgi:hypothetical protein
MSEETIALTGAGDEVRYREIPGYPGYRIGSDGSVWSCRRPFRPGYSDRWRRLKVSFRQDGYAVVGLRAVPGGRVRVLYVHRLLLEAFVGPCPKGKEACHDDGNPSNNTLANLRWDTRPANSADSARHGTLPRGSRKPNAKLREKDIPLIRQLRGHGFTYQKIADLFGVADSQIRSVMDGKTWKHTEELERRAS